MNKITFSHRWLRLGLVVVITACWYALPLWAQTSRNWTGTASANWSDPNNWSPAGTPQSGDTLNFGYIDDSNRSMVNDILGLTVGVLNFENNDYQLDGNSIAINDGALNLDDDPVGDYWPSYTVTINCPLVSNASVLSVGSSLIEGILTETTINLHLNGPVTVQSGGLELVAYAARFGAGFGSHIYVSGVVSGPGDLFATVNEDGGHVGIVEFNGTPGNTFSGTMFIGRGYGVSRVVFNKSSGFVVTNRLAVVGGSYGMLQLSGPNQVGNDATVEVDAGSMLQLVGNNMTVGTLVFSNYSADAQPSILDTVDSTIGLNDGVVSWNENAAVTPIMKGQFNLNGVIPFNINGPATAGLDVQAALASGGGFNKFGNATLVLETNNTFTGPVYVSQGILDVRNNQALGSPGGSTTLLGNGSLTLRNVNIAGETLYSEGTLPVTAETIGSLLFTIGNCSWSGPIQLDQNLVVYADNTTLSGPISGVAGLDFRNGTAVLGGSTGNLYTGTTLVRCALLEFAKPSGVNAYDGPLVVGGGGGGPFEARWLNSYQNVGATATLYGNGLINLSNSFENFGPVTFNGGEVDTGTGAMNIYAPLTVNPAPTSAVINGALGLPPGDNRVFIVGDGAADCDLLVNAVVFGSPGTYVVKQGPGTMCLTAANTFNAPTLLEQGILDVNNSAGLGTWAGLVIFDGATVRLSGSGNGNGFEAIGAGVGGTHGAVEVVSGASWNIPTGMLLDGPTTLNVGGALALNGAISSSGPGCSVIKTGTGLLTYGGGANNTYSGDTIVSNGPLYLIKSANVISVPGNLIIGPGPAGPPTLARMFQTGGLGSGSVTVNANSLFDLNGYSVNLTQLNLNDGGSVTTGSGTLYLVQPNPHFVPSVNVGSLNGSGSHATCTISGLVGLPKSVTFNVSPRSPFPPLLFGPELDIPASISGGTYFPITAMGKYGLGQMRLSGNNSYYNQTLIYEGTVIAASNGALGNSTQGTAVGTYVYNGASLALDGGISISGEYLQLNSTNPAALNNLTGNNIWSGEIYLSGPNSGINVGGADFLIPAGLIDGPGALTKVGTGNLLLGGVVSNSYAGETYINQGTVLLDQPDNVAAIPGAVEVGAIDGSSAGILRNLANYQIGGNILVHSQGLYDVNGLVEDVASLYLYGGGTVQTGVGNLSLNSGGAIYVYPGTNTTATINGNLYLNQGNHLVTVGSGATSAGVNDLVINATINQGFSASGLQKEGPGRMRLTGTNYYGGATVINAGTLQVDGSQGFSPVTVNSGTLQGTGTVGVVSVTSALAKVMPGDSPGILNCGNLGGGSGVLRVELNGTNPGTGYDQLNVSGTVDLTGMSLNASLGYTSSTNDTFTIINNDGTDPVTGTFSGLPQDKKLYIGQQLFQINYNGGSGNDVVLSRLITPPPPTLTIQSVSPSAVRLLWATNDPPFSLQTASSLPSTNWSQALPLPVIIGTNNVVTNLISNSQQFYRLSNP